MSARRTASQIATFAALAVATFGGSMANAASLTVSNKGNAVVVVVVLGGKAFAISLTGLSQTGGAGVQRLTGLSQTGGAG